MRLETECSHNMHRKLQKKKQWPEFNYNTENSHLMPSPICLLTQYCMYVCIDRKLKVALENMFFRWCCWCCRVYPKGLQHWTDMFYPRMILNVDRLVTLRWWRWRRIELQWEISSAWWRDNYEKRFSRLRSRNVFEKKKLIHNSINNFILDLTSSKQ